MKYKQLTLEKRYQISALNKLGKNQTFIANEIGVHKATICRELSRNSLPKYSAKAAHVIAKIRHKKKPRKIRLTQPIKVYIGQKLKEHWSPQQISGRLHVDKNLFISHETIYPHHLNSPTVYNSVFFKAQFWDGRSPHLADQAQGSVQAGPEMATPPKLVEQRITSIPAYMKEFKGAYGDDVKVDFKRITSTIAIFEKTLVTPSRYDDFLNGKADALNKKEKEGMKVFLNKGCASCHNGIALGGSLQPFQIASQYKFMKVGDFKGND